MSHELEQGHGVAAATAEQEIKVSGIRQVDPSDYPMLLVWLQDESIAHHLKTVPQSLEEVAAFYSHPTRDSYIAQSLEGQPVGVFSLGKPQGADNVGTIERFAVWRDFQRNGYGREMLGLAIEEAFGKRGYDGVRLKVGMGVEGDEKTVAFYTGSKFIATTVTYFDTKKFGVFKTREEAEVKRNEIPGNPYRHITQTEEGFLVYAPKTEMELWNPDKYDMQMGRRVMRSQDQTTL